MNIVFVSTVNYCQQINFFSDFLFTAVPKRRNALSPKRAAQSRLQMDRRISLHAVLPQSAVAVSELLSTRDQTLAERRDASRVLEHGLHLGAKPKFWYEKFKRFKIFEDFNHEDTVCGSDFDVLDLIF